MFSHLQYPLADAADDGDSASRYNPNPKTSRF